MKEPRLLEDVIIKMLEIIPITEIHVIKELEEYMNI